MRKRKYKNIKINLLIQKPRKDILKEKLKEEKVSGTHLNF